MQNDIHQITLTQKKEISVTGVDGVLAFSESKITLSLKGGGKLCVAGNGLRPLEVLQAFPMEGKALRQSSSDNG